MKNWEVGAVLRATENGSVEGIVQDGLYQVIGKSFDRENLIFAVRDLSNGDMRYSMDRFELVYTAEEFEQNGREMALADLFSDYDVPTLVRCDAIPDAPVTAQSADTEPITADMVEDKVNSPNHYTSGGIESIDYMKAKLTHEGFCGFLQGNVLKYISRAGKKDDTVADFKKAQWYLNRLLKELE